MPSRLMKNKKRRTINEVLDSVAIKDYNIIFNNRKIDHRKDLYFYLIKDFYFIVGKDQYHARDYLKNDSIVIDVGANHGLFSLLAASLSSKGRIYAFEPVTEAFSHLQKNVEDILSITTIQAALGNVNGNNKVFFDRNNLANSTLMNTGIYRDHKEIFNGFEEIKVYKLDSFVKHNEISKISFIKIDAEGSELEILKGAKECIKKFKPVIAISAYHQKNDKKDIVELVLSIDSTYKFFLSKRGEEDLIFHH
jgi:FkbM family methyltransferase